MDEGLLIALVKHSVCLSACLRVGLIIAAAGQCAMTALTGSGSTRGMAMRCWSACRMSLMPYPDRSMEMSDEPCSHSWLLDNA